MDTTSEQNNIGHERIRAYLKDCQKATPKGVSIKCVTTGGKQYLQLRFSIGEKERALACGCELTMQGITDAAQKAVLVGVVLKEIKTESEFLAWYGRVILKVNVVRNDLLTFGDAIAKIEQAYWFGTDKKRNKRDRVSLSQQATYQAVYGRFYALLPTDKLFNTSDVLTALYTKQGGT
ncbi:hypothetical protein Q5688_30355, partial [Microcoleus sp. herbarium5]